MANEQLAAQNMRQLAEILESHVNALTLVNHQLQLLRDQQAGIAAALKRVADLLDGGK